MLIVLALKNPGGGFGGSNDRVFSGVRYLTRALPKGSAATEAKAEWCNVLQLLRLEGRLLRSSVFQAEGDTGRLNRWA